MSVVSYLSVKGMVIFLDCKHNLLSRKKLHCDEEGEGAYTNDFCNFRIERLGLFLMANSLAIMDRVQYFQHLAISPLYLWNTGLETLFYPQSPYRNLGKFLETVRSSQMFYLENSHFTRSNSIKN